MESLCFGVAAKVLRRENERLVSENTLLNDENSRLREENDQLRREAAHWRAIQGEAAAPPAATSSSVLGSYQATNGAREVRTSGSTSAMPPSGGPKRAASRADILKERRVSLGELPIMTRSDHVVQGVLPLAAAFDRFDKDRTGSLSVSELRLALESLGVRNAGGQADALLAQYDRYPDRVLDVKEFAALVRDINLIIAFDEDGDGYLNGEELLPALESLGLNIGSEQVEKILERFDVDASGTIDLLELSSLVRTVKAFVRYDADGSGTIDADEMRDALRRLGVRAGSLEEGTLFRKYDADASGTIELHEFATLVRDLQQYAQFDTNCDGAIDCDELYDALQALGVRAGRDETIEVFEAIVRVAPPSMSFKGSASTDKEAGLSMNVFTNLVSDLRAFNDHDADADGVISLVEASAALTQLGVAHETSSLEYALERDDDSPRGDASAGAGGGGGDGGGGRRQGADGAAQRSGFNKAAFVTLVKTLASDTMRKRKQGSGEPLLMGARSVLGETTKKLLIA